MNSRFQYKLPRGQKSKIASFTGQLECARRIGSGRGSLIICDTKENLEFEAEFYNAGEYEHTFYPLCSVLILIKAGDSGGFGFPESFFNDYEYNMRTKLGNMYSFRWIKNDV